MGKQLKRSKSKSATKRTRSKLMLGPIGNDISEDIFDSSRSRFKSAISRLKDADFDFFDNCCSSDEDDSLIAPVDPSLTVSVSHSPIVACLSPDVCHGAHSVSAEREHMDSSPLASVEVLQLENPNGQNSNCLMGTSNLNSNPRCLGPAHALQNSGDVINPVSPTSIHFGEFSSSLVGKSSHTHGRADPPPSTSGCSLFHHKVRPLKEHEILSIPSKISQQGVDAWSHSLVGFFVGGKKSIHYATFWANHIWGERVDKVYFKGNGLYIFKFKREDDLLCILSSGPIYFGKSLMILHRWQPGIDLVKVAPSSIPIWINLHNVPLALWHDDGIAFLASHFGKPLSLDDHTKNGNKLAFARVCVDIEATTIVPSSFKIQIENCAPHEIKVEIPWQPRKCLHCKTYGHSDATCLSKPRQKTLEQNIRNRKAIWKEVENREHPARPLSPSSPPSDHWNEVEANGAVPTDPTLGVSISGSPSSLENLQVDSPDNPTDRIGQVQSACTPDKPVDTPKRTPSPGSSSVKRVHFDKIAVLLDKTNLAKQHALATISFPALKSCLKVSTGRTAMRLIENIPP